jgi:hypothetical protein
MKYFTPELIARLGSTDDDVADAADAEWDQVLERYEQHLQAFRGTLPEYVREFEDLLLHDAEVCCFARRGDQLFLVLHKDIPPRDIVLLTYTLTAEPLIDLEALPVMHPGPVMKFLYDEFDALCQGSHFVYTQSILFTNGWEVTLRFSDVRVILAQPVGPLIGTVPAVPSGVVGSA